MNVASLENSKKLYELSGWMGAPSDCVSSSCDHHDFYDNGTFICPKYGLGYLLRKLDTEVNGFEFYSSYSDEQGHGWTLIHDREKYVASTPEDATALLCIKLFEEGILKK